MACSSAAQRGQQGIGGQEEGSGRGDPRTASRQFTSSRTWPQLFFRLGSGAGRGKVVARVMAAGGHRRAADPQVPSAAWTSARKGSGFVSRNGTLAVGSLKTGGGGLEFTTANVAGFRARRPRFWEGRTSRFVRGGRRGRVE